MLRRHMQNMLGILIVTGLFGLCIVDTVDAQQPNTRRLQVIEVVVQGGRLNDFVDLRRQIADAAREKGLRGTQVWQVMLGDTNMFHIVQQYDSFADMEATSEAPMDDEDWGRWVSRIQDTVHSRRIIALHDHHEMGIPASDDAPLVLVQLVKNTVKPGMGPDYADWLSSSYIPALEEAGHQGISIAHEQYGGSVWTWYLVRRIDSLGDLDSPTLSHLDVAERRELMRVGYDMTDANEGMILRYREDLSF